LQNTVIEEASAPAAVLGGVAPAREAPGRLITQTLALLALGHFTVDLFSSAVPTLQPFLAEHFSLSLAQAGLLGGVFMLTSAVMQLPFGLLSDRLHTRLFTVLAPLAAGLFLTSLPLAAGFKTLLLLVALGGMAIAAFHPQSTTQAATLSGSRSGLGVAFFISAGMLGFSMGPVYFSLLSEQVGFNWLPLGIIPGVLVCAFLFLKLPPPKVADNARTRGLDAGALRATWKPIALHYGLVVLRSVVHLGIGQFLTLYLYNVRGFTFAQASLALTLFFASAAGGTVMGGNLADRFGGKRVVLVSMIGSVPFLYVFLASSGWVSLVSLFTGGLILLLTIPVNVVMAQRIVPSQAGTVTALMMGFAWGMVGITIVPLMGWLADHVGLEAVMWGVVSTPLAGFLLALRLPHDAPKTSQQTH
jgi:FSR family fosmidomycin resistance protein-like MFS transporter